MRWSHPIQAIFYVESQENHDVQQKHQNKRDTTDYLAFSEDVFQRTKIIKEIMRIFKMLQIANMIAL